MKKIWIWFPVILLGTSCSVNRQISRMADHSILKEKTFESAHTGISVFDVGKDKFLYNYQGDKYFVPASNTKLLTCYAAMKYLGDSLPGIRYRIADDTTVIITGTGDPTILHPDFPRQPVIDFLQKFGRVELIPNTFDAYLGDGWSWNDYMEDYLAPRSGMPLYGDLVRLRLNRGVLDVGPHYFQKKVSINGDIQSGFSVTRPWEENRFILSEGRDKNADVPFVPDDITIAGLLADTLHIPVKLSGGKLQLSDHILTQPLDSLLTIMMHRSDNFFAEQSLLMVSEKILGEMDDRKIIRRLLETDYAAIPQKPGWVDGSGLSRYNLVSPQDFVFILRKMNQDFGLERIKVILPTGGTGTLSTLYLDDSGKIFAKTGTLNGVVALSGYLITRKNRLLIFSVLVNNHRSSASDIRKGIERFIKSVQRKY